MDEQSPQQPQQPDQSLEQTVSHAATTDDTANSAQKQLRILGIHHITAICANQQRTIGFYRDVLGMSLVKQTVNFDDPDATHLYFADAAGNPGTVITFFEYPTMEPGQVGVGSTHHFALRVGSLEELAGWRDYLRGREIQCTEIMDRKYFQSIYLNDPDGHIVEIATDGPGFFIAE